MQANDPKWNDLKPEDYVLTCPKYHSLYNFVITHYEYPLVTPNPETDDETKKSHQEVRKSKRIKELNEYSSVTFKPSTPKKNPQKSNQYMSP